MRVVEDDSEEEEEVEVTRKLNYSVGLGGGKLNFSPKTSSMKKKAKVLEEK